MGGQIECLGQDYKSEGKSRSLYLPSICVSSYIGISITIRYCLRFYNLKATVISTVRVPLWFRSRNPHLEILRQQIWHVLFCSLAFIPELQVLETFIYHYLDVYIFHFNCSIFFSIMSVLHLFFKTQKIKVYFFLGVHTGKYAYLRA